MSQHFFSTTYQGQPVSVCLGWDRPLQGFFMLIEKEGIAEDADQEFVYLNLEDPDLKMGFHRDINSIVDGLARFEIAVPEKLIVEVIKDKRNNVGNRVEHY